MATFTGGRYTFSFSLSRKEWERLRRQLPYGRTMSDIIRSALFEYVCGEAPDPEPGSLTLDDFKATDKN